MVGARVQSVAVDDIAAARRATPADIDLVTDIVTLAFAEDPLWRRPLSALDAGGRRSFWRLLVEGALRYPWTWLLEDGAATSLWIPPGGTELSSDQEERLSDLATRLGEEQDNFGELMQRFEAARPRESAYYYLSILATHPDHRGRGLGIGLLAQNLALIDQERVGAYLESSNPANIRRYERVGFTPMREFHYAESGPVVTTMWRPAR
jgi:ribosomal protein S18 acetylase RimI-like enzyme